MSVQLTYTILDLYCGGITYDAIEYSDGTDIWRKGVRNHYFVLDYALTPTGFDGIENTDWINVVKTKKP